MPSGNIISPQEAVLTKLGEAKYPNDYFSRREFQLYNTKISVFPFISGEDGEFINKDKVGFEVAGPMPKLFFDPRRVKAGIVTCGGICPGLNNVIRSIVMCLWHNYEVKKIVGFQYGLQGFISKYKHDLIDLNPDKVGAIHGFGGTILGTSRGPQDPEEITDTLDLLGVNQIYFIGGNGTLKAANAVHKIIRQRGLKIAVICIPKTIDNDIEYVSQSFGFDTAVEVATAAIRSAHVEANASPNGIGLVKLMGRDSGFIAATASIAQRDVNMVLIPEMPFELDGKNGLLESLKRRMLLKKHAVIVVAEGAGQDLIKDDEEKFDASGNKQKNDIGLFLKHRINAYFASQGVEINLKYIDPSYLIRSVPSNTHDNLFSATLGQNAVHAGMAGYTDAVITWWHGVYSLVPISLAVSNTRKVNPKGRLWLNVLESTGQESFINS